MIGAALICCVSILGVSLTSGSAYACGGFFCNASQPVNQAAERILFAPTDGQIEMHVQIQYQGPPTGFGWILPVTPGVETEISSEALFIALDRIYGPQFFLRYEYDDGCEFPTVFDDSCIDCEFAGEMAGEPDPVQVISREPIGPYDRAILQANEVQALRDWLDENEYQIPAEIDEKLQPYIEAGAVFVVIKLLPDQDVGDLVPLKMTFPGDTPTIPIIPTSVSAEPDMGMIVHILGAHRAIPTNYQHVVINEAAIDWINGGNNYSDVVSQAVDEAGGRAFATDYSGEIGEQLIDIMSPYDDEVLADLAAATTFGEISDAIPDPTNPDYQRIFTDVFGGQDFTWDTPADGLMLYERIMSEFNPVYESMNRLLFSSSVMTRLYTTMSADEMTIDPLFSFNTDLEPVENTRSATLYVSCDGSGAESGRRLELSDGRSFDVDDGEPIERQDGETVRGDELSASMRVEQLPVAGQPEVLMETPAEELTPMARVSSDDDGCQQQPGSFVPAMILLMGSLIWTRRRRSELSES